MIINTLEEQLEYLDKEINMLYRSIDNLKGFIERQNIIIEKISGGKPVEYNPNGIQEERLKEMEIKLRMYRSIELFLKLKKSPLPNID